MSIRKMLTTSNVSEAILMMESLTNATSPSEILLVITGRTPHWLKSGGWSGLLEFPRPFEPFLGLSKFLGNPLFLNLWHKIRYTEAVYIFSLAFAKWPEYVMESEKTACLMNSTVLCRISYPITWVRELDGEDLYTPAERGRL